MKTLKWITGIALMSIFSLTSCQSEVDEVEGDNPNTNTANSTTATNLKRVAMFDGSSDDFIDGSSCSALKFPFIAKVNGVSLTFISQLSFEQAISILGELNNNDDTVEIKFPVTLKMSDYTEVTVNSQAEYDVLVNNCEEAENDGEAAISSLDIKYPITILTYDASLEQTGSVVITSQEQMYNYMINISSTEYFSVKYPISVTLADGSSEELNSDAELKASITAALNIESSMDEAAEDKEELEEILVNGTFKVNSFINAGANLTSTYLSYTIDFANDWKIKSMNALSTIATGTYQVTADTDLYLQFGFAGSTDFSLFNNTWKVISFTDTTITLESKTNSAVKLILKK
ncbi:hypothetical protein SAMN05443543_106178 [Flavobacterium flevense]|uniref:Uncharacterized protein n=1 Tax=Flavobacterium flevense TaxID=983 RepID=A0A4Y4ATH9_9FLAO|nr:hypothetical protein [Flavobacterium flevense]GEC71505.1 hypothetical protein FFL01_10440 [Flavobacterium flevense]SHL88646.1 hypothetical protein SAMN05443543_106178 [Flavobacterium flevense]